MTDGNRDHAGAEERSREQIHPLGWAVLLLVLYVFSIIPVVIIGDKFKLGSDTEAVLKVIYFPVLWLMDKCDPCTAGLIYIFELFNFELFN